MRLVLYKRGKVWWARGGRHFRKSTGHTDERKARLVVTRWERELADPTHYRAHQATVSSAAERWLKETEAAGMNPETRRFYDPKIRHVVAGLGHVRLADLTHAKVLAYVKAREATGAARHSVHRELTALRLTLRSASRAGEFGQDVKSVIPRYATGYVPRTTWLTDADAWRLIGALAPERAAIVAFILATAADRSSTFAAQAEDVTPDAVFVRGTKTSTRKREVPRVALLAPFLTLALEHGPPFRAWDSMPRDIRAACKRAGVQGVTARDLRRTVATWLVKAGVPFEVVAKFMGHGSTAMLFRVYGQLGAADVGRLIDERTVQRMYNSTADKQDNTDAGDAEIPGLPGKKKP